MKEPDHKVKRHIVPFSRKEIPYWSHHSVHGWLGSGVNDKNGVEIYEGDKVVFGDLEMQGVVIFHNGALGIEFNHFCKDRFTPLDNLIGFTEIEVVGHVAEEATNDNRT